MPSFKELIGVSSCMLRRLAERRRLLIFWRTMARTTPTSLAALNWCRAN
jgi:hypothetical protein